jgi:hypothetical protein
MATKARSTGAKRTRSERASVGTEQAHRRHVDVLGDFIKATIEYASHPETPEPTRDAMLQLMQWMRNQIGDAISKRDSKK